jgi:NADH-quinone oxidoreductase subunit L
MSSALIISKTQLLLIVLLPLLGSLVAGLFGRKIGRQASHSVTILGVAASCVLSAHVLQAVAAGRGHTVQREPLHLVPGGNYSAHVGFWSTS